MDNIIYSNLTTKPLGCCTLTDNEGSIQTQSTQSDCMLYNYPPDKPEQTAQWSEGPC